MEALKHFMKFLSVQGNGEVPAPVLFVIQFAIIKEQRKHFMNSIEDETFLITDLKWNV